MFEWLGISHLFELSGMEAVGGFFTPLAIFAVFFCGACGFAGDAGSRVRDQSGDGGSRGTTG